MPLDEAPPFWWKKPGPLSLLLLPFGWAWGQLAALRMTRPPDISVGAPVLCVGNFITGGAGKTPTALAFCRAARKMGRKPGFLSRGYGGGLKGPVIVDPKKHRALDVGDEPLELAANAMTVVSADRGNGASLLVASGCDFVIMDDGFQNPGLAKDFSLIVVDAKRGLGNGLTFPAGPMRAPLGVQLARADAVLIIGDAPAGDMVIRLTARRAKPVYTARMRSAGAARKLRGKRVLAFAGIADPEKLFHSLEDAGVKVARTFGFPDHHFFTEEEAETIMRTADEEGLELVSTTKDLARMRGTGEVVERLAERTSPFPVRLEFDDDRAAEMIIDTAIKNCRARQLRERGG